MTIMEEVTQTGSLRKRPRSTSPMVPLNNEQVLKDKQQAVAIDRNRASRLRDPKTRNDALNELLKLSSAHDINYSMPGALALEELVNIAVYDCLDWNDDYAIQNRNVQDNDSKVDNNDNQKEAPVFCAEGAWKKAPTLFSNKWAYNCQVKLGSARGGGSVTAEKLKILSAVMVILRNLSFVAANLRLLAYSPGVLALLIGCLYEGTDSGGLPTSSGSEESGSSISSSSLALCAVHALVHLAPYLDISGQKLLSDKLFYAANKAKDGPVVPESEESPSFGQAARGNWGFGGLWLAKRLDTKEDVVSDVSKEFLLSLTEDYLVSVWSIFPALNAVFTNPQSTRPVIMMALDLLQELINHARVGVVGRVQDEDIVQQLPTVRAVLVNIPSAVLIKLTDLLYIPRLGPDSLDYINPVHNIVTRVTTLKLLMGYDATVDTDLRDRVLDVLVPLLELDSPRMAAKLGADPLTKRCRTRLFDALVPCLTTTQGRNEASMLASQLLRELAKAEENSSGLAYIQERLVDLASRDPRISHLVWNHLYVNQTDDEELASDHVSDEEG